MHQLLSDPSRWCQGYFSRDADGKLTGLEDAYSYDIIGALLTCYKGSAYLDRVYALICKRVGELYPHYIGPHKNAKVNIVKFNDRSMHSEVLEVLKELDV